MRVIRAKARIDRKLVVESSPNPPLVLSHVERNQSIAIERACQAKHDRPPCGRLYPLKASPQARLPAPRLSPTGQEACRTSAPNVSIGARTFATVRCFPCRPARCEREKHLVQPS